MSVLSDGDVFVKGASDTVLPLCVDDTTEADAVAHPMAAEGLRVLAVASRPIDPPAPCRRARRKPNGTSPCSA